MGVKNTIYPIPMVTFDTSTFTGSYQLFTTLPQACTILKIVNNSNVGATISLDGTTAHDFYPATSGDVYDFQTNKQPMNDVSILPKGTSVYISGSSGTGLVYLVGWYQPLGA